MRVDSTKLGHDSTKLGRSLGHGLRAFCLHRLTDNAGAKPHKLDSWPTTSSRWSLGQTDPLQEVSKLVAVEAGVLEDPVQRPTLQLSVQRNDKKGRALRMA